MEGRIIELHSPTDPKPTASDFLVGQCPCNCCHSGDLGACDDYLLGGNGRCVYCDHGEPCHERDKNRRFYNGPITYGIRWDAPEPKTGYYRDSHGCLRRTVPKARKK